MDKLLRPNRLYYVTSKERYYCVILKTYVHPTNNRWVIVDSIGPSYGEKAKLNYPMLIDNYSYILHDEYDVSDVTENKLFRLTSVCRNISGK